MDGASSVLAVVSLGIQLVESCQKLRALLGDIDGAPDELKRLVETLDQFKSLLEHVNNLFELQYLIFRLPGTPTHLIKTLRGCEKKVKALERFLNTLKGPDVNQQLWHRTWASIRLVRKKEEIREIHAQLQDAKADLHHAISSNSWLLQ